MIVRLLGLLIALSLLGVACSDEVEIDEAGCTTIEGTEYCSKEDLMASAEEARSAEADSPSTTGSDFEETEPKPTTTAATVTEVEDEAVSVMPNHGRVCEALGQTESMDDLPRQLQAVGLYDVAYVSLRSGHNVAHSGGDRAPPVLSGNTDEAFNGRVSMVLFEDINPADLTFAMEDYNGKWANLTIGDMQDWLGGCDVVMINGAGVPSIFINGASIDDKLTEAIAGIGPDINDTMQGVYSPFIATGKVTLIENTDGSGLKLHITFG